jgi:hypothetical protein
MQVPCYPAGKGKDSYSLRLKGKGIQEIDGYANRRVMLYPYPTLPIAIPTRVRVIRVRIMGIGILPSLLPASVDSEVGRRRRDWN